MLEDAHQDVTSQKTQKGYDKNIELVECVDRHLLDICDVRQLNDLILLGGGRFGTGALEAQITETQRDRW